MSEQRKKMLMMRKSETKESKQPEGKNFESIEGFFFLPLH